MEWRSLYNWLVYNFLEENVLIRYNLLHPYQGNVLYFVGMIRKTAETKWHKEEKSWSADNAVRKQDAD